MPLDAGSLQALNPGNPVQMGLQSAISAQNMLAQQQQMQQAQNQLAVQPQMLQQQMQQQQNQLAVQPQMLQQQLGANALRMQQQQFGLNAAQRNGAISLMNGLVNMPDQNQAAQNYPMLRDMAQRLNPGMTLPDNYDQGAMQALVQSQIPAATQADYANRLKVASLMGDLRAMAPTVNDQGQHGVINKLTGQFTPDNAGQTGITGFVNIGGNLFPVPSSAGNYGGQPYNPEPIQPSGAAAAPPSPAAATSAPAPQAPTDGSAANTAPPGASDNSQLFPFYLPNTYGSNPNALKAMRTTTTAQLKSAQAQEAPTERVLADINELTPLIQQVDGGGYKNTELSLEKFLNMPEGEASAGGQSVARTLALDAQAMNYVPGSSRSTNTILNTWLASKPDPSLNTQQNNLMLLNNLRNAAETMNARNRFLSAYADQHPNKIIDSAALPQFNALIKQYPFLTPDPQNPGQNIFNQQNLDAVNKNIAALMTGQYHHLTAQEEMNRLTGTPASLSAGQQSTASPSPQPNTSIPDGSIAVNPKNNARVVRRNGQWVPL